VSVDLTLRCPECGKRADMCFDHGDDWKKRPLPRTCPHCGRRYWSAGAHMEECSGDPAPVERSRDDDVAERWGLGSPGWVPEWERGSE
jgi:rRNA maturation protein Nop10